MAQEQITPGLPDRFAAFADLFSSASNALEIACGAGAFTTWLGLQGVHTTAYDQANSPVYSSTSRCLLQKRAMVLRGW